MEGGFWLGFFFLAKENIFEINANARAISPLFSCYHCYHKILDNGINAVLFQTVAIRKTHCISFLLWRYYTLLVVSTSNEKSERGSNTRWMFHPVLWEMRRNQISFIKWVLVCCTAQKLCSRHSSVLFTVNTDVCEKWLKMGIVVRY